MLPAVTGLGLPVLVTARSQVATTLVTTTVLLVAEFVAETEELAVMVGTVIDGATFTTTMISAEVFAAMLRSVQVTEVVVVHIQPAGAETETNVVFAGIASVKLADVAAAGPLLATVCV